MVSSWRTIFVVVLLVILAGSLGGCGSGGEPAALETVMLSMGYTPNVQFAPFYVAVEKGYFADEGIQIEFDYGWETDLLKLVGSGERQFAIASGDQVILARSQELPVVYIMNWYRRFPVCVVSLAEAGIEQPADLVGRLVGTPAIYGASYIGWRALLDAAGLDEAQIELISIGYTQVAALTTGQVEAAICYAMNEPVQLLSAGHQVDVIYVADYANLVSNGLITNDRMVRESPERVQAMVRAALRGLAYTIEHPDEAFEISKAYVPELTGDAEAQDMNRAVLAASIDAWRADPEALGLSYAEEWQLSQRIMAEMDLVSGDADVTTMFSNRFVEEAGDR